MIRQSQQEQLARRFFIHVNGNNCMRSRRSLMAASPQQSFVFCITALCWSDTTEICIPQKTCQIVSQHTMPVLDLLDRYSQRNSYHSSHEGLQVAVIFMLQVCLWPNQAQQRAHGKPMRASAERQLFSGSGPFIDIQFDCLSTTYPFHPYTCPYWQARGKSVIFLIKDYL